MSAGVGRKATDNPADYYPTPCEVAKALRVFYMDSFGIPHRVIDPCAGTGALLVPWHGRCDVMGIELNRIILTRGALAWRVCFNEASNVRTGDGLEWLALELGDRSEPPEGEPPLLVINPPFKEADRWVAAALSSAQQTGAALAVLLRSQWIDDGTTVGRATYRYDLPPHYILRLPWRVSFDGDGADSCTYAWHIWRPHPRPAGGAITYWARPRDEYRAEPDEALYWERARELAGAIPDAQLDLLRGE